MTETIRGMNLFEACFDWFVQPEIITDFASDTEAHHQGSIWTFWLCLLVAVGAI